MLLHLEKFHPLFYRDERAWQPELRINQSSFHFTWVTSTDVCVCILPLCELQNGEVVLDPRVFSVATFVFRLLTKCRREKKIQDVHSGATHL